MVAITAILPDGRRLPVLGRVGQTLAETLGSSACTELAARAPLLSPTYGHEAHVATVNVPQTALPPMNADARRQLAQVADGVRQDSRLASTLKLTREWMGAVVALRDLHPWRSV